MEEEDPEKQRIFEQNYPETAQIDPKKARFPCCVVWTPLPFISWLLPFIGHMGICREDGVILDFAGPNFVCVDNFAFGSVTRYLQINKEKDFSITSYPPISDSDTERANPISWDDALRKSTQEYQHHAYSLFTCNCHSFVANNLNRLGFLSGGWNVVNIATLMFLKGQWVSTGSMVRSYLPFLMIFGLGLIFGGSNFFTFWAFVFVILVGWFLVGTYCFKDLITL